VQTHLVERHGHDRGLARVRGTIHLGSGHGGDGPARDRLTHDEQIGEAGPEATRDTRVRDLELCSTVEQGMPFLLRGFDLLRPVALAQLGQIGRVCSVRSHDPTGARFARFKVPDQDHRLGPGRPSVGLERVCLRAYAENQHAIGPLVPAGNQVVPSPSYRIYPGGVLAPAGRIAAEAKGMGLGIAIRHDDPEDRCGESTVGLQPNLVAGLIDPERMILSYAWEINGDLLYTDASGVAPTLSWVQVQALNIGVGTYQVRVMVTAGGRTAISKAVTVKAPPSN
jgi:hypothetical protein